MPVEHGLPLYVSKNARSGFYQYYRRPPKGVSGAAFVRSFGSKDRKTVVHDYSRIHAEAETYFDRLITGRAMNDQELFRLAMTHDNLDTLFRQYGGKLSTPEHWHDFVATHGSDQMKALSVPDRYRLIAMLRSLYAATETLHLEVARIDLADQEERFAELFGSPPPATNKLTLMGAFEQAWLPAKARPESSISETRRYVTQFVTLNGDHGLPDITRDHWAAWRADCLAIHGPGWTAFKRYNMVKAVVNEAIRAGLFERKLHTGQDVVLTKPGRTKLRNEGWSDDELKELFTSEPFTVFDGKHRDAEYWVPTIIALTGARLSEVTGMNVRDVGMRHGVMTFYLAREQGKTEDSRRIIPVPQKLVDLGLLKYIAALDPNGALFPGINADIISKWFGRHRRAIGVDRKGCDIHAMRHHIKTKLGDLGAPDRVSNYITGHVGDGGVGATYGKTELQTALRFLNQIDLGVKLPKWKDLKHAK